MLSGQIHPLLASPVHRPDLCSATGRRAYCYLLTALYSMFSVVTQRSICRFLVVHCGY
jgi:hypothetical protein